MNKLPIFILLLIIFAACSKKSVDDSETNVYKKKVAIVLTSPDSFKAPDSLLSGYYEISFSNQTKELHSAHLIKLNEGYTASQLINAYADSIRTGGDRPKWMTHWGGVISQNGISKISLELKPGNYVWVCVMGSDSLPHFVGHENKPLHVAVNSIQVTPLPDANVTITMTDENHSLNQPLNSGSQTVEITNSGSKYHLAAISRLNEGSSVEDVISWYQTYDGPPPVSGLYSTSAIGPGLSARMDLDLQPGTYILYCMANAEGKFHLLDGAITTFEVE
ncbi:hypothetical protein [Marinigracilibium pacificum]|uniref:Uncharacterized protein n=1 Tax=Marinigracilibium pacificum TaxID=2729599 RepID=A0A848ITE3_9BACT|nr:hypothetical protein [Marinigracilibium pacificum]NMM47743.1 hypothetical protein [Marinigracilibium pacificum]